MMKNDNYKNFESWFIEVLESLYPNRNAGLIIFIVSLALLERYLREKLKVYQHRLPKAFFEELIKLFSALSDNNTARKFWSIYRHGLLHQVTIPLMEESGKKMPSWYLSHDLNKAVLIDEEGRVGVNTVKFSECVISLIKSDFSTFKGCCSQSKPLLEEGTIYNTILTGTSSYFGKQGKK